MREEPISKSYPRSKRWSHNLSVSFICKVTSGSTGRKVGRGVKGDGDDEHTTAQGNWTSVLLGEVFLLLKSQEAAVFILKVPSVHGLGHFLGDDNSLTFHTAQITEWEKTLGLRTTDAYSRTLSAHVGKISTNNLYREYKHCDGFCDVSTEVCRLQLSVIQSNTNPGAVWKVICRLNSSS